MEHAALTQNMILPAALLVLTYAAVIAERLNRAVIALIGGGLVIVCGVLDQNEAIRAIDFNTLALLTGMMILVGVAQNSGLFGYIAVRTAQILRGSPAGILFGLALVTAVLSALLDNVTTVLLIVPVTIVICSELKAAPYPFLFAEIFASNIGGTSTLIGDPPNILIGSAVGLTFMDFVVALLPVVIVIFVLQAIAFHFIWGIKLKASAEDRARVMTLNAKEAIADKRLLVYSLIVLGGTIVAFILAHELHLEAGTIALLGAAILLALDGLRRPRDQQHDAVTSAFHEVEWITIFFFVGLFILVGGVEKAGILEWGAGELLRATGGDPETTALGILWGSAILSALVDNIPFVATMIPLIKSMGATLGDSALGPMWWALSLGACLGGNGTLIGASANLTVAGLAEKSGVPFRFATFAAMAFPMMLVSIAIAHVYLLWRFY